MSNLASKSLLNQIRADLVAAHKAVEAKYGITLSLGGMRYEADGSKFVATMEAVVGSAEEAAKREFLKLAPMCGLSEGDFGREIAIGRQTYKIVGMEAGRRGGAKVQITRQPDGKRFAAPIEQVKESLGKAAGSPVSTPVASTAATDSLQEMLSLIDSMGKAQPGPEFMAGLRREDEIFKKVQALSDQNAGPVGKLLKFQVADGHALYLVTKVDSRYAHVRHIPFGDAWNFNGVVNGKLDRRVAEQNIAQQAAMARLFSKAA